MKVWVGAAVNCLKQQTEVSPMVWAFNSAERVCEQVRPVVRGKGIPELSGQASRYPHGTILDSVVTLTGPSPPGTCGISTSHSSQSAKSVVDSPS